VSVSFSTYTGEEQQFGASCSTLNGGLHERGEAEFVALVNANSPEMMQQIADHIVVP